MPLQLSGDIVCIFSKASHGLGCLQLQQARQPRGVADVQNIESALTATHRLETKQLGYTASLGEARSVMFRKQRSSLAYRMLVLENQKFECVEVRVHDVQEAINQGRWT